MLTDNISFQSLFKNKACVLTVYLPAHLGYLETVQRHQRVDFPFEIGMGLQPELVRTCSHHLRLLTVTIETNSVFESLIMISALFSP